VFLLPDRSPWDWSFRLFGISVRIHRLFWLGSALLGNSTLQLGADYFLLWMLAVLVSILLHELGHALAYRLYRVDASIVLTMLAGLTVPSSSLAGRWQRVFVSLAGPGAGFLLAAAIYFIPGPGLPKHVSILLSFLFFINLYWGVINLLPVWPLDGGKVSQELCTFFSWRHGRRISLEISLLVAGLIVAYSLVCEMHLLTDLISQLPRWFPRGTFWTAILFGLLAYQSYQQLQSEKWSENHWQR